jgi:hypothetical protein
MKSIKFINLRFFQCNPVRHSPIQKQNAARTVVADAATRMKPQRIVARLLILPSYHYGQGRAPGKIPSACDNARMAAGG